MLSEVTRIESHAFGAEPAIVPPWIERAEPANVRVWLAGEVVAAVCLTIPMGIWLGGRSIKNLGFAGVAVAPERRGGGYGRAMMAATLREARAAGWAVSTLYASTQTFYRTLGYEAAGGFYEATLPMDAIDVRSSDGEIVPLTKADQPRLAPLERRIVQHGNLDRGPYVWARTMSPRLEDTTIFGISFDGALEGYVMMKAEWRPGAPYHELRVTDVVGTTPRAMRRAWSFLSDHRAMARTLTMPVAPHDPFLTLLGEHRAAVKLVEHWMLRVLDVRAAFEGRGYSVEKRRVLVLDVTDDLIPESSGLHTLVVEDGRATLEPGGTDAAPHLRVSARGLAPLLTNYQPASTLARMGLVEGGADALETADRIFEGRSPFMRDFF
ncbi:GNAT family N-acetyltransferase [Myxococcota bacterium]|nr:GNAT family N-acetyltransferase [Myxococcota bacterium]